MEGYTYAVTNMGVSEAVVTEKKTVNAAFFSAATPPEEVLRLARENGSGIWCSRCSSRLRSPSWSRSRWSMKTIWCRSTGSINSLRRDNSSMLITLQKVGKSFGAERILEGVTATVDRQDRIGIIGENGTGKTTLVRIITGSLAPTRER